MAEPLLHLRLFSYMDEFLGRWFDRLFFSYLIFDLDSLAGVQMYTRYPELRMESNSTLLTNLFFYMQVHPLPNPTLYARLRNVDSMTPPSLAAPPPIY